MGKRGLTGCHNHHPKREKNHLWKGGYTFNNGRKCIRDPKNPMATKQGYVVESRLIMSKILNRPLDKSEIVHHKNGKINDNKAENLVLYSRAEHVNIHREYIFKHKKFLSPIVLCHNCKTYFRLKRKPRCQKTFCSRSCFFEYKKIMLP